jgi:formate dehydrogenase gamma subunit
MWPLCSFTTHPIDRRPSEEELAMSQQKQPASTSTDRIKIVRTFPRFSISQRWEHAILLVCVAILLLTGLPQKYNTTTWSQAIISSPERLATIQLIHHITALVLTALVIYHLGKAIYQISRRRLPGDMLPSMQDVRDAWNMLLYLLFINKHKPVFGKYNFEQKVTYWFLFFGIGILIVSGFTMWFPEVVTRVLPGGVIPAAIMAHGTEAIVTTIFIVIWHFYHVHFERLNLSIFSGWLNEEDMSTYHSLEYKHVVGETRFDQGSGDKKS